MLSTWRRNPENDDYNRCIETFPYLFDRCPDLEFESLGFKQDINIQGNYVRRESTITQESRQRAKCLTHEYQAEQIMERKIQLEVEASRNKAHLRKGNINEWDNIEYIYNIVRDKLLTK